ncbi:hypothetical protein L1987_79320 [Smallanthus sonchifolius]|uniref:Uncharacterized protein n=1 Tax=Smallanthus sonchifolius TaxID=185202 RepID=A0ACB8ZFE2_9ASTR|nr:hypothetical protein L1987_79320 [Smallanthus sonchifolius]
MLLPDFSFSDGGRTMPELNDNIPPVNFFDYLRDSMNADLNKLEPKSNSIWQLSNKLWALFLVTSIDETAGVSGCGCNCRKIEQAGNDYVGKKPSPHPLFRYLYWNSNPSPHPLFQSLYWNSKNGDGYVV